MLLRGDRMPRTPTTTETDRTLSYFDVRGVLEMLFDGYRITTHDSQFPFLHPAWQEAILHPDGTTIGYLGHVHPTWKTILGEETPPLYVAEMRLDTLTTIDRNTAIFKPFSKYPAVQEALSLVAQNNVSHRDLAQTIQNASPFSSPANSAMSIKETPYHRDKNASLITSHSNTQNEPSPTTTLPAARNNIIQAAHQKP